MSVKAGPSPKFGGRAALRRAQRRAMVRQSRQTTDLEVPAMACAQVCAECGRLGWPTQRSHAHPLRHDEHSGHQEAACEHCGETAWIDLARDSTLAALRVGDEAEAQRLDANRFGRYFALGGLVVALIVTVAFPMTGVFDPLGALATFAGALTAGLAGRRFSRDATRTSSALPQRWSLALPPARSASATTEGAIVCTGEPLRSPLTRQPCVAYEVGLRDDERADAELGTWVLLEQRLAPAAVDDVVVDPSRTHLSLPRTRIGTLSKADLDDAALVYFRERGYTVEDAALQVYETILEAGARVVVRRSDQGCVVERAPQALAIPKR